MRKLNRNTSLERAKEIAVNGGVFFEPMEVNEQQSRETFTRLEDHQHYANARAMKLVQKAMEICYSHGLDFESVKDAATGWIDGGAIHPNDVERCFADGIPLYTLSR
ncbi:MULTISPECIES: hypothetical protein [Pseudomonas]|uniref:hypothetical protein n=1 Tax=Pseudomonas TaxID=286 RepID=UPI00110CD263|nr:MULTISPECIES: hypothetical protein [Pseudomonas]MBH3367871.1 hypothetical protein [Pseudomonas carnis]MBW4794429.1 hypothetical protein [Pseudomonas tolaasii]